MTVQALSGLDLYQQLHLLVHPNTALVVATATAMATAAAVGTLGIGLTVKPASTWVGVEVRVSPLMRRRATLSWVVEVYVGRLSMLGFALYALYELYRHASS